MTSFLRPPLNPRYDVFVIKCIQPCAFDWHVVRKDILRDQNKILLIDQYQ
jgi:hypothetical protein